MAKVRSKDIIQDDIFQKTIVGGKETIKVLDGINVAIKDLLKTSKKGITNVDPNNLKSIQTFNAEFEKSTVLIKEKTAIEKQLVAQESKLAVATSKQNKELTRQKEQLKAVNRQTRLEAKATTQLSGAYERQSALLNVMVKKYQNFAAAEGKTTKESKRLLQEINKLDTKLKGIDQTVGRSQRNVGNYGKALNGLKNSFRNVASAAGLTLGVFGAFRVIKGAVSIIQGFEKSLSSLQSITGSTNEEMKFFRDEARKLGRTTSFSASQAAKAFEIIGSKKPELLKSQEALAAVTKEALLLAEASGLELPEAANALTGTLNQFDLAAGESTRVINALAAGSKFGAAAIPQISEAIDKFGAIAATSNVSVEESVALVETLAEKNLLGAEAGTKLRNVLTKLNVVKALSPQALKQLEKFGVDTEIVADQSLSLSVRLRELSKISGDATALVKVFGEQNQLAGKIILDNVDKVDKYTEAVTGTNTATEQAAINQDNLTGDLAKLSAMWSDIVLGTDEATGASSRLREGIQFLTDNLETILSVLFNIVKIYGVWKIATFALRRAQAALRLARQIRDLKKTAFFTKAVAAAQKAWGVVTGVLSGKLKLAALASKAFGMAMKVALGPIGIAVGVIGALATVFALSGDKAAEAAKKLKEFQKELDDIKTTQHDLSVKFLNDISNGIDKLIKKERQRIDKLKINGLQGEKLAAVELASIKKIKKAREDANKEIGGALRGREEDFIKAKQDAFTLSVKLENDLRLVGKQIAKEKSNFALNELFKRKRQIKKELAEARKSIISNQEMLEDARNLARQARKELDEQAKEDANKAEIVGAEQTSKTLLQILKDRLKEGKELLERSFKESLEKARNKEEETAANILFEKKKQELRKLEIRIKKIEAALSLADKKIKKKTGPSDAEKQAAKDRKSVREDEAESIRQDIEERNHIIEKGIESLLNTIRKKGKGERSIIDKQIKDMFDIQRRAILDEKERIAKDDSLSEIEKDKLQNIENGKLKQLNRDKKAFNDDLNADIADANTEFNDMELAKRTEFYNNLNQIADAFAERERKRSQEKIDDLNKEIAAREESVKKLEQLASMQNANAAETIAFEERRIADLERKKKKEQAKQKLVEIALAAFKAYTSELESGKKPVAALSSTFKNITLLSQFVRSIPAFDVGSEYLDNNQNIDGKGGFLAVNHVGERILTAGQNNKLDGISNEELADIGQMYKKGVLVPDYAVSSTGQSYDFTKMEKEISGLRNDLGKLKLHQGIEYNKMFHTFTEYWTTMKGTEARTSKAPSKTRWKK